MSHARPAQSDADNARDAVALVEACIAGDLEAKTAILGNCDPVGILEAVIRMTIGLLITTMTAADVVRYLDQLRAGIPHAFGEAQQ